ncbi:MAG: hypothetical protein CMF80_04235 [Candidatus Marinimicrobia bacterium]|jgi:antitoxin component YwqK of YwqJK toxin-antitoxin module|nr:hypothetical protein [Candidatus Neomarinimicrobiota bacterium]|tara:strand:+ start:1359 stop:1592 length:234 start_codon:yes stop_codon:yes gene_type:complete
MKERITKTKQKDKVVIVNNSGTVIRERNFQNDQLNGPIKVFYDNGQPRLQGQYKNNARIGVWKHFDPEGKVVLEETF